MLENCKTAQERWGGTHEMIDRWLSDRQQALISFFAIQEAQGKENLAEQLQIFSQQLVDYISEGHFEIYEQLFREAKEYDDGGLELAHAELAFARDNAKIAKVVSHDKDSLLAGSTTKAKS